MNTFSYYELIPICIKLVSYSPHSLLLPIQLSSSVYKTYKWFYPTEIQPNIFTIENSIENDDFTVISKISF